MISVETVGKIRRRHLVNGESISKIARETGLSRHTVKRYLRNAVLEPRYTPRLHQVQPKLGPFVAKLEELLEADAKRAARERRTAQRLFEALRLEGYAGAYDSVRRFVKRWAKDPARGTTTAVFIPLYFAPGEAYQFDWSHEVVDLGGLPLPATALAKSAAIEMNERRERLIGKGNRTPGGRAGSIDHGLARLGQPIDCVDGRHQSAR